MAKEIISVYYSVLLLLGGQLYCKKQQQVFPFYQEKIDDRKKLISQYTRQNLNAMRKGCNFPIMQFSKALLLICLAYSVDLISMKYITNIQNN